MDEGRCQLLEGSIILKVGVNWNVVDNLRHDIALSIGGLVVHTLNIDTVRHVGEDANLVSERSWHGLAHVGPKDA